MQCMSLIAEEITPATFNREIIYGSISAPHIAVPVSPYVLRVDFLTYVDEALYRAPMPVSQIVLLNGNRHHKTDYGITQLNPRRQAFIIQGTAITVSHDSLLTLETHVGETTYKQHWEIIKGAATLRKQVSGAPVVAMLGADDPIDSLRHIKDEIQSCVLISDQFIGPKFIREFFDDSTKSWDVRIITSAKEFTELQISELEKTHPHVKIRADRMFHDRLIYRDAQEIYVFGASLNSLNKGRISFFQRIFSAEQAERAVAYLEQAWAKSIPIRECLARTQHRRSTDLGA